MQEIASTTATHTVSRFPALRSRRAILAASSLILAGAVVTYTSTRTTAAETATAAVVPPAPKVTIAPVEEQLVAEYEELTGRVDATETVELRARVSGHLEDVRFQAGQLVQKGDVLFTIDPRWYRAQFDLATAQVEQAKAHAAVAEREAKRADELVAASAISSEEADAKRSRSLEARAALASAEAALTTARLDLEYTEVRAPIAGQVSRAFVTEGNLVSGAPGNATLLTTIVSTGEAFVYADIDETTLLKFNRLEREGRLVTEHGRVPVELQLADETGYPRHGYIESSDNRLNPATGSLLLRMVFANADHALVPGLFARVRVPVGAPQPTLLISERAVGTDQSQKFVFALAKDNTVAYRTVKLGGTIDGKRIVYSGLHAGDQIVVNGLQRVRPGMTVAPEVAAAEIPTNTATRLASR
jgi:RND family efflux transporter MFP subunit